MFPSSLCSPCSSSRWHLVVQFTWFEGGERKSTWTYAVSPGSSPISAEGLTWSALCGGPCCGVMSHLLFGVMGALAVYPLPEMICPQWHFHLNPRLPNSSGTLGTSVLPQWGCGWFWTPSFQACKATSSVSGLRSCCSAGCSCHFCPMTILLAWRVVLGEGPGQERETGFWSDLLVSSVFPSFPYCPLA